MYTSLYQCIPVRISNPHLLLGIGHTVSKVVSPQNLIREVWCPCLGRVSWGLHHAFQCDHVLQPRTVSTPSGASKAKLSGTLVQRKPAIDKHYKAFRKAKKVEWISGVDLLDYRTKLELQALNSLPSLFTVSEILSIKKIRINKHKKKNCKIG